MDWKCLAAWSGVVLLSAISIGAAPTGESLVDAVRNSDRAAVRALLQQSVNVNQASPDGTTALHWAVQGDDAELVRLLLQHGANATAANRYGVQPLSLACVNGNAAIIERLIAAGADVNGSLPGGERAIMTAARTGKVEAIKILVAHGADVNANDAHGQTALMWAASKNNAATVKLLVEVGAQVDARTRPLAKSSSPTGPSEATAANALVTNFEAGRSMFSTAPPTGFTSLLFAVRSGSIDAVRVLLDAGANVNDVLSDGESALVVAVANAHWQLASFLLDRGADPNLAGAGWNALHQAVRTRRPNIGFGTPGPIATGTVDSLDVIKKLIEHGANVNAPMTTNGMKDGQRNRLIRLGATPFFLAAKNTDVEVMKVLVGAGADARIPNAERTTPLMVAAGLYIWNPGEDGGSLAGQEDEVLDAVKICVDLGNDVNAADGLGYTALHGAAFRGVNSVVEYLVAKGAKLDTRNARGWTALAIANGLSYSDFFKQQPQTADLLRAMMTERGLSTDDQVVDPKVCLDCLQTVVQEQRSFAERERTLAASFPKAQER